MFDYLGELIVYQWMGVASSSHLGSALQFFFSDAPKILVMLSIAIFVISVIGSYFPPEKIKKFLSRKQPFIGNIIAALIGIMTPFCSCSAVPLFIGLIEAGVPLYN